MEKELEAVAPRLIFLIKGVVYPQMKIQSLLSVVYLSTKHCWSFAGERCCGNWGRVSARASRYDTHHDTWVAIWLYLDTLRLGLDRYVTLPMLSADVGLLQMYHIGAYVLQYLPILKLFFKAGKIAWTCDLKWCNQVVSPAIIIIWLEISEVFAVYSTDVGNKGFQIPCLHYMSLQVFDYYIQNIIYKILANISDIGIFLLPNIRCGSGPKNPILVGS